MLAFHTGTSLVWNFGSGQSYPERVVVGTGVHSDQAEVTPESIRLIKQV